jgi:hypothetical protein
VRTFALSPGAHECLEQFYREHTGDPSLHLPVLALSAGTGAAVVTRLLGVAAITLGHRVLITPALVMTDGEGRLVAPADLVVHEAAHALQYRAAGAGRFLAAYARDYLALLWRRRRFDAAARQAAYRAIPAERAARAAAAAYRTWSLRQGAPESGLSVLVRA